MAKAATALFWCKIDPQQPLTTEEMDEIYEMPLAGTWHPSYDAAGGVPALAEVEFSLLLLIVVVFGGCSFCAIGFSIKGVSFKIAAMPPYCWKPRKLTEKPNFKGYIHDVRRPAAASTSVTSRVPA